MFSACNTTWFYYHFPGRFHIFSFVGIYFLVKRFVFFLLSKSWRGLRISLIRCSSGRVTVICGNPISWALSPPTLLVNLSLSLSRYIKNVFMFISLKTLSYNYHFLISFLIWFLQIVSSRVCGKCFVFFSWISFPLVFFCFFFFMIFLKFIGFHQTGLKSNAEPNDELVFITNWYNLDSL